MTESLSEMLKKGKPNSLGRVAEIIDLVLADQSKLDELYSCLFLEDAWARMRAADALEKVCRIHPEWLEPYITKIQAELSSHIQPSIQWHIAQIYRQVRLSNDQKQHAYTWLSERLKDKAVDWIVAANCMDTLVYFVNAGDYDKNQAALLIELQLNHKSNAVKRRANKLLAELR